MKEFTSNSQFKSKHKQKLERWLVSLEFTRKNNQNKNGMIQMRHFEEFSNHVISWKRQVISSSMCRILKIPFHKCRNGPCGSWSNHKWAPHHWPLNLAHRFYYCFSGKRPQFFVHFWRFPLQTDSHSHLGIQNKAKRNFCPNAKDFFAAKKP